MRWKRKGAQVRPAEQFEAAARAQDPLRYTRSRTRRRGWHKVRGLRGGQFQGHRAEDIYTPEEICGIAG